MSSTDDPVQHSPAGRPANLILIGYRGSGKSSVGRRVASELGWAFIDTDDLIEATAGKTIAEIFETQGEPAFRETEARAVEQAVAGRRRVVSVGGGAVLSEQNRTRLRAAGICIWLTAPPEELYRRLQGDPDGSARRPALTDAGGLEEVRRVLAFRRPLYEAVADRVVDTAGKTAAAAAREVLALVAQVLAAPEGTWRST